MVSSKNLLKVCNIAFPFTDFMYLLQQEEYSLQRIWFWLPRFFWRRNIQLRDTLKYTQRVKVTLFIAALLLALLIVAITLFLQGFIEVIVGIVLALIMIPFWVIAANAIVAPFYERIKSGIIRRAQKMLVQNARDTKVIVIAGSYGKTTTKNFIEQMVRNSFRLQMVPGNINSTIGIAAWLNKNFRQDTEVLVAEVDAYKHGRIARSCQLLNPDIAILTNIGDQHLQRFGTRALLAKSLTEVFNGSRADTIKITTQETLEYIRSLGYVFGDIQVPDRVNNSNLSASNNENLSLARAVATFMQIPLEYQEYISNNLALPDRRQRLTQLFGYDAIDDSYNISLITGSAGIDEARRQANQQNKKLVVITAGIPETGPENADSNEKLGAYLATHADAIIVLESIFAVEIKKGLGNEKIAHFVPTFAQAVNLLQQKFTTNEWLLLLQPELTDLYY